MRLAFLRAVILGALLSLLTSASTQVLEAPRLGDIAQSLLTNLLRASDEDEPWRASASSNQTSTQLTGIQERTLDVYGRSVRLLVVRPSQGVGELPGLLLFQAGGNPDRLATDRFARAMSTVRGDFCTVLVVRADGQESTESLSPADAYFITRWVAEHGTQLGIDGKRLAVFGVSPAAPMRAPLVRLPSFAPLQAPLASARDDLAAPQLVVAQPVRTHLRRASPASAPSSLEPAALVQPNQPSERTS